VWLFSLPDPVDYPILSITRSCRLPDPDEGVMEISIESHLEASEGRAHEALHQGTKEQLKTIVERIERLEEEKAALASDIRDVYAEAKSNGFDVKALRSIIRIRKKNDQERIEEETVLATYMHALGMIDVG
jgi:uncharacterized protein (UPF0335 family)